MTIGVTFFTNRSIPDQDKESKDEVQKRTAHLLPLLSAALLIPGLLSSFMISSLSDHYGRRVAMGVLFGGLTSNIIVSCKVIVCFKLFQHIILHIIV